MARPNTPAYVLPTSTESTAAATTVAWDADAHVWRAVEPPAELSAASSDLAAGQVIAASAETIFAQSNPWLRGAGIVFTNGALQLRGQGFYLIVLYLQADRTVNGLAHIRIAGGDYRSMPLADTSGGGHASGAVTCIALSRIPDDCELSAAFSNTDSTSTTLLGGRLSVIAIY